MTNDLSNPVSNAGSRAAPLDSIHLHGFRVDRVSMDEAIERIARFVDGHGSGPARHVLTADASMVVAANDDSEFAAIARAADLVTPDGAGILWAARRLGTPITHKVSGVDLSARLCALSAETGWRIFFFGAGPGVAEEAAARMRARYPGAQIVGARDGFFQPSEEPAIVEQIRAARPDILLVALGIPKQEKFIARHKDDLGAAVCIGVGGTFDVFSGTVKRAPRWMQNSGLEWAYRLASNPKKISKVALLPRFVRMTLQAAARQQPGKAG